MTSYTSPYGFDPIVDFMLDSVFDRGTATADDLTEAFSDWIDEVFWPNHLGPAIDELEARLLR